MSKRTGHRRVIEMVVEGPIPCLFVHEIDALGCLVVANPVLLAVVGERVYINVRAGNVWEDSNRGSGESNGGYDCIGKYTNRVGRGATRSVIRFSVGHCIAQACG